LEIRPRQITGAFFLLSITLRLTPRRQAMESRSAAHAVLQDRRLLRVMYMIFRARYQRRRLEGIADSSRLKEAWVVWKTRLLQRKKLEGSSSFSQVLFYLS
jgi:hypothetical protein